MINERKNTSPETLIEEGKELVRASKLRHIFVIPDGNRRWAREHKVPVLEGHRKGAQRFVEVARAARNLGIEVITFWGFSTENWERARREVNSLMSLIELVLRQEKEEIASSGIVFRHIGRKDRVPQSLFQVINQTEEETRGNTGPNLVLALDYGGQDEILRAANRAFSVGYDKLTPDVIEKFLDTAGLPPVDLVIRTSGEQRTSGGMIWQSAYAEFLPVEKYFPDFEVSDLIDAIRNFSDRKRRYGR